MKYPFELAERGIKVFQRIADSLEKIVEHQPEPLIYFVAEGQVNMEDFLACNLPPGRVVRCTMQQLKAMQPQTVEAAPVPCPTCAGRGFLPTEPGGDHSTKMCPSCSGSRRL